MSAAVYYEYNPWWEGEYTLPNIIDRPMMLSKMEKLFANDTIVLLTGLRRIGKTTLLKLFIQQLLKKGIAAKTIFYVSLDDYVLDGKSILEIVEDYRKIHKLPVAEKVCLFFDEVSHKEDFQQQLKNLYDRQNVKIYATSSSSSLLRDSKAYLTGREFVIEVLPLDFSEYLEFKQIAIKKRDGALLESYFEDYLQTGGIPQYVLYKQREYLQNLVDDIIYKDIIAYHNIRNPQVIKDLFKIVMGNVGSTISIYKISNTLKISSETTSRYLQYMKDTYLIYLLARHGKTNQKLSSPQKVYAGDMGIRNLFTGFIRKGRVFENYVFLKIKDYDPVYVLENQIEIDFYLNNNSLIEVKYGEAVVDKQKELFETFPAAQKLLIQGFADMHRLTEMLAVPPNPPA